MLLMVRSGIRRNWLALSKSKLGIAEMKEK